MGPTSSPPSSTVTLFSNPSSPASTSLVLAIPTTTLLDLYDDDNAHSLFDPNWIALILIFSSSSHSTSKLRFNGTYKTRISEIVRSSLTFKAEKFTISNDRAKGKDGDGESNEGEEKGNDEEMDDWALGRRDMAMLFFLLKV
ncbi:hypothetical protein D8674_003762 [Pyrus ussuriensis x Pyrus communis]|uniref:Uncharacterized protein n=1 Tax=Pyrus ussuriensis x Pyrus communis TaxID=2448454 RepID=A0A5N5FIK4_9ROSA|nr:hypothetical protein D8674_003762 [Pyrus ussuriensis x Pyrus communis]